MTTPADAPYVVVGPLLRYVDTTTATIWVEADRSCEVSVLGHRERTWEVHGHHYALVVVEGLEPGSVTPYTVELDGQQAWPEPGSTQPPSVVRTVGDGERDGERVRLAFGSCRRAAPFDRASLRSVGADALVALAERMMGGGYEQWPHALLLAGDQVYADDPSPAMKHRLQQLHALGARQREGEDDDVREEIIDFEEYTWLYQESWRSPSVRWLLSTLPTCMVLDDHDLRDDWNSSWSWRQEITQKSWWRQRVVGAFSSYWVYQHLGNLSPEQLAQDEVYRQVREAPDAATREQLLADFALRADSEPTSARWSFHRDFGRSRLVVLDSRCSRVLDPGHRAMVDATEWEWFREVTDADVDHLLIGTSLPFLPLNGLHHLEGWDEATAQRSRGPLARRLGEKLRLALDLEHWSAFRRSFDAMVDRVAEIGGGERPPATVMWLSGDVHCSYVATADVEGVDPARTAVHQLTMSPFRNPLEPWVRLANTWFEKRPVVRTLAWMARRAGVREPGIRWTVPHGPWFPNGVMTVDLRGRRAAVEVEHATVVGGAQVLDRTLTLDLSPR